MKRFLLVTAVVLLVVLAGGVIFVRYPLWVNDQVIRYGLWRSHVKSEYLEAGGHRLHYFEASPPDGSAGTPLLLVHGLGASGQEWAAMMPGLAAKGFHVYAPDLPGYGRSSRPDVDYSISFEEQTTVDFMRSVHLTRADIGGWSMGGWISMKLALDHPELVDRLVVYDSAGVYFPASEDVDIFTPTDVAGVHRLLTMLSPRTLTMPDFVAKAVVRRNQEIAWVIHRNMVAMMSGQDLLDFRLHKIRRPTLVMWGSRDDLIPLAVGERIHDTIPGSSLAVVEGCGHLMPAECPKPAIEATVEFLRSEPVMRDAKLILNGGTR
jgi:pimeloyl-ACP methyl ester carboxylesterase